MRPRWPANQEQGRPARHGSDPTAGRVLPLSGLALVLGLVALSTAFQLAVADAAWARVVTGLLQAVTLLVSLRIVGAPRLLLRFATVVAVAAIAGTVAAGVGGGDVGAGLGRLLNGFLVVLVPPALLIGVTREIRQLGRVSLAAVLAVLSVYLLLGMAFGLAYGTIDELGAEPALSSAPEVDGRSEFLYFSFVTLTTTGYGDLVPATDLVRSTAVVEALIGQIYLVTVVALLVGNLRPSSDARPVS